MRIKYLAIVLASYLVFVTLISGCRKCYICYSYTNDFTIVKGTDTSVWKANYRAQNVNAIADTLRTEGYVFIDTQLIGWQTTQICGKLRGIDLNSDSCVLQ